MSGVVAVVAHPDDESLIAGGTLALAAAAGVPTGVISLTRGELGPISDPALATRETLADVRRAELVRAGTALGVDWTTCLELPDGELQWCDEEATVVALVERLAGVLPSVVLTFGADGLYHHPDHVAAGRLAAAAVARVGSGIVLEACWPADLVGRLVAAARARDLPTDLWGLEPEAFGSEGPPPDVVVDGTRVLERKLAAIRAHRTQVAPDHLLHALPGDLAREYLAAEPWRLRPPSPRG